MQRCLGYFPDGSATFSQFAWVVWDTLKEKHPEGIKNHHNLERAALVMQQAYEDAFAEVEGGAGHIPQPSSESALLQQPEDGPAPLRVQGHAGDNPQPLPLLQLLTLFSVVVAGPVEDRVDLLFDLHADPHPALAPRDAAAVVQQQREGGAASMNEAPEESAAPPETLTEEQMLALINSVRETYQLPARQCVHEVSRMPTPTWAVRTPEQHLEAALADRKMKREDCRGGFDRDTVEDLLFAKGVCLWAECYNEVR